MTNEEWQIHFQNIKKLEIEDMSAAPISAYCDPMLGYKKDQFYISEHDRLVVICPSCQEKTGARIEGECFEEGKIELECIHCQAQFDVEFEYFTPSPVITSATINKASLALKEQ